MVFESYYRPRTKYDGKLCFKSVHTCGGGGGGGVPLLHPIILPLVPCPFWGYPISIHNTSTGPMFFLGGYSSDWSQVPSGGITPVPGGGIPGCCTPSQVRMGYPPASSEWGTPLARSGCGTLLPVRMGYSPSQVRMEGGYPYPIMLCNISQNAMGQTPGGDTLPGPAGGVPCGGVPCQVGYPPPGQDGGVPCRGGTQVGQQKEYSLHGGRYASCVHAGGLSC